MVVRAFSVWLLLLGFAVPAWAKAPPFYVFQGQFENVDVLVKVNGFILWAHNSGEAVEIAQAMNGFLRPGENLVEVSIRRGSKPEKPKLGYVVLKIADDKPSTKPEPLYRFGQAEDKRPGALFPYVRTVKIDIDVFPALGFWQATAAPLDPAAREAIAANLTQFSQGLLAAAQTKDPQAVAEAMVGGLAADDLSLALGEGELTRIREDIAGAAKLAFEDKAATSRIHPVAPLDQLVFEQLTPQHVRVRRRDGAALTGLVFTLADNREFGFFLEQPIYGYVRGAWTLLRN